MPDLLLLILFIAAMFWAAFWTHDALRESRAREEAEERAEENYEAAEWYAEKIPFGRGSWPEKPREVVMYHPEIGRLIVSYTTTRYAEPNAIHLI